MMAFRSGHMEKKVSLCGFPLRPSARARLPGLGPGTFHRGDVISDPS